MNGMGAPGLIPYSPSLLTDPSSLSSLTLYPLTFPPR